MNKHNGALEVRLSVFLSKHGHFISQKNTACECSSTCRM